MPLQFSLHCCTFQIVEVFQEGVETVLKFLNQIQLLHPRHLNDVEGDFTSIDSIPGFQAVLNQDKKISPLTVKNSKDRNLKAQLAVEY